MSSIDLDDEAHFHYYPTDGSIRLCEKSAPCFRSDMHYWVLAAVGPMAQRLREDLKIAAEVRSDCEAYGNSFHARDETGAVLRVEPSKVMIVALEPFRPRPTVRRWPEVMDSDEESEPGDGGELLVDWKAINEAQHGR